MLGRIPKKNKKKSRDAPLHNHKDEEVIGVLDIDSPLIARFDEEDREGLSRVVQMLEYNVVSTSKK